MRRAPRTPVPALAAGAVTLVLWASALAAHARPVGVEDLLRREDFGAVQTDPTGRWLVVERRAAYQAGARFDLGPLNDLARTRLLRIDLSRPGPPTPLFPAQPGVGYSLGAFAPDGRRLAVYRLTTRTWELGVASLATGRVRWLGVTPEFTADAQTVQWVSDTSLLAIVRPQGDLPFLFRFGRNAAAMLPARWAATATGGQSTTAIGSGRYRGLRPKASPRRVLRLDAVTGSRRVLASGAFVAFEAAPDRQRIALIEAGDDLPMAAERPVQGLYGFENVDHRLRILDLPTGRMTSPCSDRDVLLHPLSWSPDSHALLLFGRRAGTPWPAGALLRLEVGDAAVAEVQMPGLAPRLDLRPEAARAGWIGRDPLVWAAPSAGGPDAPAGWHRLGRDGPLDLTAGLEAPSRDTLTVTEHGLLIAADGQVWRIDPEGRRTRAAAAQPATYAQVGPMWHTAYAPPRGTRLLAVQSGPNGRRLLAIGDAEVRTLATLPDGDELLPAAGVHEGALVRRRQGGFAEQLAWIPGAGPVRPLATINVGLANLDASAVRPIHHRGPDGEPLTSWLVLPAGNPPGSATKAPPPLVVWPYLGSRPSTSPSSAGLDSGGLDKTPALLAAHGYAVLIPSLPAQGNDADPIDGLAERVLGIIDTAHADPTLRDAFDPDRLGVWGVSYGGYTTLALLTQTPRFRAGIAEASMSDLFSLWGEFEIARRVDPGEGLSPFFGAGWTEDMQGDMHGPPWADPQRYLRNSPALHADRITTPLLLLHGDQDGFPLGQAEEMFSGLLRQDKDAVLVTYWGDGHGIASPGNLRDLYARSFAWLDAYLFEDRLNPAVAALPSSPGPAPASDGPRIRRPSRSGGAAIGSRE